MARSSHPTLSRPREPGLRRVPGGSERPIRPQTVLGVLLAVVLVAVPLYLLRRPAPNVSETNVPAALGFGSVLRTEIDAGVPAAEVTLGPAQRVRCGISANQISSEGSLCDALPELETALARAIVASVDCAPRAGEDGSINYVLEVDFQSHRLNIFAGKSGLWRGPRVRKAITCAQRALPSPDWENVPHQHQYYAIAILATYPMPETVHRLPTFE